MRTGSQPGDLSRTPSSMASSTGSSIHPNGLGDSKRPILLEKGTRVLGNYMDSGNWYPGTLGEATEISTSEHPTLSDLLKHIVWI